MARRAWRELRAGLIGELCEANPPLAPLDLVRGTASAVLCLQQAEQQLRASRDKSCWQKARLASVLDLQRRHVEALELLGARNAGSAGSPNGRGAAAALLSELVKRHIRWQEDRQAREKRAKRDRMAVEILPGSVSREEVLERFLQPGRPCVIRNFPSALRWTPAELREKLGSRRVPVRRCAAASANWASMLVRSWQNASSLLLFIVHISRGHEEGCCAGLNLLLACPSPTSTMPMSTPICKLPKLQLHEALRSSLTIQSGSTVSRIGGLRCHLTLPR